MKNVMLQAGARVLLGSAYHWLPYDESLQTRVYFAG
jgi:hypothetical protein